MYQLSHTEVAGLPRSRKARADDEQSVRLNLSAVTAFLGDLHSKTPVADVGMSARSWILPERCREELGEPTDAIAGTWKAQRTSTRQPQPVLLPQLEHV